MKFLLELPDYAEYLINPCDYEITELDAGIILSPNQEEVNTLMNLIPQNPSQYVKMESYLSKLQILNTNYESKGNLIHDYYLMRECYYILN